MWRAERLVIQASAFRHTGYRGGTALACELDSNSTETLTAVFRGRLCTLQKLRDDADDELFTHLFRGNSSEVLESMACLTYTDTGVQQSVLIVERPGRTPLNYLLVASILSRLLPSSKDGRPCFPEVFMSAYDQDRVARYARLHSNSESTLNVDEDSVGETHRNMIMTSVVPHEWINVTDTVAPDQERMQIILANGALRHSLISQLARCVVFLESVAACRDLYPRNTCVCVPADVSEVHVALVDFEACMVHNKKEMLDLFSDPVPENHAATTVRIFNAFSSFFKIRVDIQDSDRIICAEATAEACRELQKQSYPFASFVTDDREGGGQRDRRQRHAGA